jgi:hypothetical protein
MNSADDGEEEKSTTRLQDLKVLSPIGEIVSSADGSSSADAGKNLGQRFRALKAPLVKARPSRLTTLRHVESGRLRASNEMLGLSKFALADQRKLA